MRRSKLNFIKRYCLNQYGTSLVFVLLSSFLLITLATIVVLLSNTGIRSTMKQEQYSSAYYIAEAGIEKAIQVINEKLYNGETLMEEQIQDDNFQDGSFKADIIRKEVNGEITYEINSLGSSGDAERTLNAIVREKPNPLTYAVFANDRLNIYVQSLVNVNLFSDGDGLLLQKINIDGNVHANKEVKIKHENLLLGTGGLLGFLDLGLFDPPKPHVSEMISTERTGNISIGETEVGGIEYTDEAIPLPQFDFENAKKKADKEGCLIKGDTTLTQVKVSLLNNANDQKYIYIQDGDLNKSEVNVDLATISGESMTIIVDGKINLNSVNVSLGSSGTPINLIAKDGINIKGLATDYPIHGIIFSEGLIESNLPFRLTGYIGGNVLDLNAGSVDSLLYNYTFKYDPSVFEKLPSGIGFKRGPKDFVEVIDIKEQKGER